MAEGGLSFSSSEESSPEMPRKAKPVFTLNENSPAAGIISGWKNQSNNTIEPAALAAPNSKTFRRRSLSDNNLHSKAILNNMSSRMVKNGSNPTSSSTSENKPRGSMASLDKVKVPRTNSQSTLQTGMLPHETIIMAAAMQKLGSKIDLETEYYQQRVGYEHIHSHNHGLHGCNQEEECWQRDCKTHKGRYQYELSKAKLKMSSGISAMLAGFSMVAIIELSYDDTISHTLLIILGVVTTLVVSVHLLSLMMSTCILAYVTAHGCTDNSPHKKLWFYIELSWIFSTCIGLILFLVMVGVVFFVKFNTANYETAAYVTTGILIVVVIIFGIISYLIHRNRLSYSMSQVKDKVNDLEKIFNQPSENGSVKNV